MTPIMTLFLMAEHCYAKCIIKALCAECRYAECHNDKCHCAECRGAILKSLFTLFVS
jgi:hypothetical protein